MIVETIKKQYARRLIEAYRSPYNDPFTYQLVTEFGIERLVPLLAPFIDNKTNSDAMAQSWIEWNGLIIDRESHLQHWFVALFSGELIGILLPSRFNEPHQDGGSLTMIAVLPEYQGMGYGKILHAKGLEILAGMGVTKYTGSTDVRNMPMLATFRSNGCEFTRIRTIEVDELGRHHPID